jgi:hypothetical protein
MAYGKKERFQQSPTATVRYRDPPSRLVENVTQFVFDHKRQASIIPNRRPNAFVEASSTTDKQDPHQCINHSGRTRALGPLARANLGGSPDEPGLAGRLRK